MREVRRIIITSYLTKIMEKAIMLKLEQIGSSLLSSGSYQSGFKKESSTAKNTTTLLNQIMKSKRVKKKR